MHLKGPETVLTILYKRIKPLVKQVHLPTNLSSLRQVCYLLRGFKHGNRYSQTSFQFPTSMVRRIVLLYVAPVNRSDWICPAYITEDSERSLPVLQRELRDSVYLEASFLKQHKLPYLRCELW